MSPAKYQMEPPTRAWLEPLLTNEEYHNKAGHDSSTTIRTFMESPALYKAIADGRIKQKFTDSLRMGTLDHIVLTEPENVEKLVAIKPDELMSDDGGLRTKAAKEWKAAQEFAGRIIASQQELDEAWLLRECVMANPVTRRVIERATIHEHSIFWETASHKLKVRIDLGIELEGEIYDVKRCPSSIGHFWTSVREYGYGQQAALYQDGYEAYYGKRPKFFWLLVSPNLRCRIERCPRELLDAGRYANAKALDELRECREGRRPWYLADDAKVHVLDCPPHLIEQVYEST